MSRIKKAVLDNKGKFFKLLSKEIFDERVESKHLKELKEINPALAKQIKDAYIVNTRWNIPNYKVLSECLAIFRVLTKMKLVEPRATNKIYEYVDLIEELYNDLNAAYWKIFNKKIGIKNYPKYQITPEQAFTELALRGFKPNRLLPEPKSKNDYYIVSHTTGLVHPVKIANHIVAAEYQGYLGIMGHVGYNDPSRKY